MASEQWATTLQAGMIKIQGLWEGLSRVLGLEVDELSLGQMALRAVVVYAVALVVVRLGKKRFLGKNTAFDFILGIMLGSVLSRAITGNSPFFPTLAASVVMVSLHWLFAVLAYHWDLFGIFVKGRPRVLIRNGEIQWKAMHKSQISERDLLEALRIRAKTTDPGTVKFACLERNGDISFISADTRPQVLEAAVEEGVQRVRIELAKSDPSPREQQLQAHIAELERKVGQLTLENEALKQPG